MSSAGSIEGHGNTIANAITMVGAGEAYLTGSSGNDTLTGGGKATMTWLAATKTTSSVAAAVTTL